MPLEMRAENGLCGLMLIEVFQMLSNQESTRRGLPRGSLFLAAETVRNLQHAAMGVISVTVSKSTEGSPWERGGQRLSELAIEQHFGRLRTQSPSAQLTARHTGPHVQETCCAVLDSQSLQVIQDPLQRIWSH